MAGPARLARLSSTGRPGCLDGGAARPGQSPGREGNSNVVPGGGETTPLRRPGERRRQLGHQNPTERRGTAKVIRCIASTEPSLASHLSIAPRAVRRRVYRSGFPVRAHGGASSHGMRSGGSPSGSRRRNGPPFTCGSACLLSTISPLHFGRHFGWSLSGTRKTPRFRRRRMERPCSRRTPRGGRLVPGVWASCGRDAIYHEDSLPWCYRSPSAHGAVMPPIPPLTGRGASC